MNTSGSTLIIIKPDAIAQNLLGVIRSELELKELEITPIGDVHLDLNFIQNFYQWSRIDYPMAIEEYLCRMPLPVWLIEGKEAIKKTLEVKNRLRAMYCGGRLKNLFHCSSSSTEFEHEFKLIKNQKTSSMKTNNQVEVIVYKQLTPETALFLMLKRNPKKGGFWQPVTGNVEAGESFEAAAIREVGEELGIKQLSSLIDTGYSFQFVDDNRTQTERVFGGLVPADQAIVLSSEHTEFYWATYDEALNTFLKYAGNKEGLKRLQKIIFPVQSRKA